MLKTGWWSRFGKWTRGQGCLTIHRCLQGKGSTFCQVLVQPGNQTLAYCFKLWYPINWANQVAVNFDHTFLYLLLTVLFLQCSSQDCFYPCTLCLYSSADQVQLEERKGQCLHAKKLVIFLVRHLQSDYSKNPSLWTYRHTLCVYRSADQVQLDRREKRTVFTCWKIGSIFSQTFIVRLQQKSVTESLQVLTKTVIY